jgi:ubiquinone biosynthesis protein UbiJ
MAQCAGTPAAYNAAMLQGLQAGFDALFAPAVAERLTLLINHVLRAEPVATARLAPHAGKTLAVRAQNWPSLLPAPPALAWRITAAGLLEWCGPAAPATPDLGLAFDAGNPALLLARTLAGERPAVQIEGDALLAADASWLLANLRWDVAADLERMFGPVVAQQLHTLGRGVAAGLRAAVKGVGALGERWRGAPPGAP